MHRGDDGSAAAAGEAASFHLLVQVVPRGCLHVLQPTSAGSRTAAARRPAPGSALGFGAAYYFDRENGSVRRKRLHQMVQRTVHNIESSMASDAGDPPPVFPPVLRSHVSDAQARGPAERVGMVR